MTWVKQWKYLSMVLIPVMLVLMLLPFLLPAKSNHLEETEQKWRARRNECKENAFKSNINLTEIQHNLYFIGNQSKSWYDATKACKNLNLDLISTENWFERDALNSQLQEGTSWSSGAKTTTDKWQWVTQQGIPEPLIYNTGADRDCLLLQYHNASLILEANVCSTQHHYICECNLVLHNN